MASLTRIEELIAAIDRLAGAIEQQNQRLGDGDSSRYTRSSNDSDLLDERTMAGFLNISYRTLGRHRRAGRLPGCSLRNGGRILWRKDETTAVWQRGIA